MLETSSYIIDNLFKPNTELYQVDLNKRFPDDNELKNLPFGDLLISIKQKEQERMPPRDFHRHMCYVIDGMATLFSEFPVRILYEPDLIPDARKNEFIGCLLKFIEIIGKDPAYTKLLRLATFYHDIGVHIRRDRHSIAGIHILNDLHDDEKKKLKKLICENEDGGRCEKLFNLFLNIVGHHELFGVLSTGESSSTIFVELVGDHSGESDVDDFKILLSILALLNLVDINARIRERSEDPQTKKSTDGVGYEVGNIIINDWKKINQTFKEAKGDKRKFVGLLAAEEQRSINAIGRLYRIIQETTPQYHKKDCQIQRSNINIRMAVGSVSVNEFCELFAHVSRLDYFLRFFKKFREEAIKKSNVGPDKICTTLITLLDRIIHGYRDLIGLSLIGVEFEHVHDDVSEYIVELLLNENELPEEGEQWMVDDETTIWVIYRL